MKHSIWGVPQPCLFSKLPPPIAFCMPVLPFKLVILGLTTILNLPLTPLSEERCLYDCLLKTDLS